jgi:hypothetical protein
MSPRVSLDTVVAKIENFCSHRKPTPGFTFVQSLAQPEQYTLTYRNAISKWLSQLVLARAALLTRRTHEFNARSVQVTFLASKFALLQVLSELTPTTGFLVQLLTQRNTTGYDEIRSYIKNFGLATRIR